MLSLEELELKLNENINNIKTALEESMFCLDVYNKKKSFDDFLKVFPAEVVDVGNQITTITPPLYIIGNNSEYIFKLVEENKIIEDKINSYKP